MGAASIGATERDTCVWACVWDISISEKKKQASQNHKICRARADCFIIFIAPYFPSSNTPIYYTIQKVRFYFICFKDAGQR
jgi:hypothetical protein